MRGPSCQLALNIKNLHFEDFYQLISDIIFLYQLAQARPHNVLHFLVLPDCSQALSFSVCGMY